VAFEVAEEAARDQDLFVGAVVVLAQEGEIRLRPAQGTEDYQVKLLEVAKGEGGPVEAVLDGYGRIVFMLGRDLLEGLVQVRPELEVHGSLFRIFL